MPLVRYRLDPNNPPRFTPEQRARLDAMTEEEIEANALSDPDNPPMTDETLARERAAGDVRRTREALALSPEVFAERFGLPLALLRDWESGAVLPDAAARAYLKVIAREPEAVIRALEAA